jgi:signal peptidase II
MAHSGLLSKMPLPGLLAAAGGLLADQISKYIIVEKVMRPEGVTETPYYASKIITVLPVFDLRLSWNTGISFSLFNSGTDVAIAVLLTVQIIITLLLLWWLWRLDRPWLQVACGLIIGGALGNIIDRATFGAVADFLLVHWQDWQFPTFNIADSCITVGAGMWLLDAVISPHHDAAEPKDPAQ